MTDETGYRKSLGLVELVSLGVGGTIGSGIFVVPGIAAGITGPSSILAWVIVALSACCVALSLAWIRHAPRLEQPSPPSSNPCSDRGYRESSSRSTWYPLSLASPRSRLASASTFSFFFSIPSVLGAEILVIMAFLGVNLIGIALSGRTENLLTAAKIVPIVIIAVALIPFIQLGNLVPERVAPLPDILKVIIIVYWPFTGFEISAIPVEETRDPRTISRALLLVMLLVCTIYLVLNISLIGSVGAAALAASPAPVAYAAGIIFSGAAPFVAVIGIITMFSALNAYIVGTSRVLQNMAKTYRLPRFARALPAGDSRDGPHRLCHPLGCPALLLQLLRAPRVDLGGDHPRPLCRHLPCCLYAIDRDANPDPGNRRGRHDGGHTRPLFCLLILF